jgi:hypothetical protein
VHASGYSRVRASARIFRQYFKDLKGAGNSLNPIERFVFSLVLANTKAEGECPPAALAPADRT